MDQETLFTASKWTILKLLSEESLSPIELAAKSGTSVANVSQQLRLLEMAGLVRSERIPNRDKGQPRVLYSLAGNQSFLITTSDAFVDKKLHQLSIYNKIILKIWFHPKNELHYYLEKAFWNVEDHLDKLDAIALDEDAEDPTFVLFTREQLALKPINLTNGHGPKTVRFRTVNSDGDAKGNYYVLHDPASIIGEDKNTQRVVE